MKKIITIAGICCALLIIVIALLAGRGNQQQRPNTSIQQKTSPEITKAISGKEFPAFNVIDIDGAVISNQSLKGKPTIVWFTTTWCTPCQIGAQKVAKFNKELGNPLNILVFFVDPRESENDLR